ncbi:MAG: multicopper oxidase family protein [Pseudomonadota bacterium]
MTTRRDVLKAMGAIGVAGTASQVAVLDALAASGDSSGVASFSLPLRIPPTLVPYNTTATADYFNLSVVEANATIIPGKSTPIVGYQGITPGPSIRARVGRQSIVTVQSALGSTTLGGATGSTVVHLHGGIVPPESDGFPTDYVLPGQSRVYSYPNNQLPSTLWYHDHALHDTAPHVWFGLSGFYLLTDAFEDALNLPSGEYEIPLSIQDRRFSATGAFVYTGNNGGETGDAIMVNGVVQPYLDVKKRKYRFRVLNGSNSRLYRLALSNGASFAVLGMEGGLLAAPVWVTSLTLAPGERADVVVDFSGINVGSNVILRNTLVGSTSTLYSIMRFNVIATAADGSVVPSTLRPFSPLDPATAVTTRTFSLGGGMMGGAWTINGAVFDANVPIATPRLGTTEIWQFNNGGMMGMNHPIHIHGVMFQILDINGSPPPATHRGWKDTVNVPAGGSARVIVRFDGYAGKYVMHCHNLEHEDNDMMARFDIVP